MSCAMEKYAARRVKLQIDRVLWEATLAAPAHSHDYYEETIYDIEGVLTWTRSFVATI
jgi:quercetin dioxygenase-like cupin family protein